MDTFSIILPVFMLIALGFVLGRYGALREGTSQILAEFVFTCAMPALLFLSMSKVQYQELQQWGFIGAYLLSLLISAGFGALVLSRVFGCTKQELPICVMNAGVTNSVYVGLPIMLLAHGSPVPVVLVVLIQVLCVTPLVLFALERGRGGEEQAKQACLKSLVEVAKTPIVAASLLGILWGSLGPTLPQTVNRTLEMLGGAAIPGALIALGLSFHAAESRLSARLLPEVLFSSLVKVVLHPLCAYLAGRYIWRLDPSWLAPLVLMAGMPSALNGFIFARRYGVYVAEAGATITLSTVISAATLWLIVSFFQT